MASTRARAANQRGLCCPVSSLRRVLDMPRVRQCTRRHALDADAPRSRAIFNRVTYAVVEQARKEGLPLATHRLDFAQRTRLQQRLDRKTPRSRRWPFVARLLQQGGIRGAASAHAAGMGKKSWTRGSPARSISLFSFRHRCRSLSPIPRVSPTEAGVAVTSPRLKLIAARDRGLPWGPDVSCSDLAA
jgi:hypothetical protein